MKSQNKKEPITPSKDLMSIELNQLWRQNSIDKPPLSPASINPITLISSWKIKESMRKSLKFNLKSTIVMKVTLIDPSITIIYHPLDKISSNYLASTKHQFFMILRLKKLNLNLLENHQLKLEWSWTHTLFSTILRRNRSFFSFKQNMEIYLIEVNNSSFNN